MAIRWRKVSVDKSLAAAASQWNATGGRYTVIAMADGRHRLFDWAAAVIRARWVYDHDTLAKAKAEAEGLERTVSRGTT